MSRMIGANFPAQISPDGPIRFLVVYLRSLLIKKRMDVAYFLAYGM
jgi:hypothetical protein